MEQQWEGGHENYNRDIRKTRFLENVVIECLIVDGRQNADTRLLGAEKPLELKMKPFSHSDV